MADAGASKGGSSGDEEKQSSDTGGSACGSGDQVKGDEEQQQQGERNQLSQLAAKIVGQALSEAESEISVHHKYQIDQPNPSDRAGDQPFGSYQLREGPEGEKEQEQDDDADLDRQVMDRDDEETLRNLTPPLDDQYGERSDSELDERTYSASPSRFNASDLMQDLAEMSNCANRIDTLLDTPAAEVSAQIRRSMSPASVSASVTSTSSSMRDQNNNTNDRRKSDSVETTGGGGNWTINDELVVDNEDVD